MPPEITISDFARFMAGNAFFGFHVDPDDAVRMWQEKNGISNDLLKEIGEALEANFTMRLLSSPAPVVDLNSVIFNTSLTGFQLGWEAALEFRRRNDEAAA